MGVPVSAWSNNETRWKRVFGCTLVQPKDGRGNERSCGALGPEKMEENVCLYTGTGKQSGWQQRTRFQCLFSSVVPTPVLNCCLPVPS